VLNRVMHTRREGQQCCSGDAHTEGGASNAAQVMHTRWCQRCCSKLKLSNLQSH
jgi:hypothetical protein